MNDSLSQFLLRPVPSRWYPSPLQRFRPSEDQALPWWVVWAHATWIGSLFGLVFCVGAKLATGNWYLAPFLFAATYAGLGGFIWACVVRVAWNRRSAHLRSLTRAGLLLPPPQPAGRLERLLPIPFFALFLGVIVGLCISVENLRGALALRMFHRELEFRAAETSLARLLPPPVPDDRNLATIPLLKPLFDQVALGVTLGVSHPQIDSNAFARAKGITTDDRSLSFPAFASEQGRKAADFRDGRKTDLEMRQKYYETLPGWPQLPASPLPTPGAVVLQALTRYDSELRELHEGANSRPECRFPVNFEVRYYETSLDHLSALKACVQTLALRAAALLAERRSDEALAEILLGERLARSIRDEPLVLNQLVRQSLETALLQPVWDGCIDRRWSALHLRRLRSMIDARETSAPMARALAGERLYASVHFARLARIGFGPFAPPELEQYLDLDSELGKVLRFTPRGWLFLNDVALGRYLLDLEDGLAKARHLSEVPSVSGLRRDLDSKSPFTLFASMIGSGFDHVPIRVFEHEAWRRLALVGIALEEYRNIHGSYPESLASLAPGMQESLLQDPMDGQPLRYSRREAETYRLYSVGLDHRDDEGKRPERRSRSRPSGVPGGDLVWR